MDDKIPIAPEITFHNGRDWPIAEEPKTTLKNTWGTTVYQPDQTKLIIYRRVVPYTYREYAPSARNTLLDKMRSYRES